MINTCISILDKLIKVVGIRGKRRNRLFSELWETTFSELLTVHRDYIEMFENLKNMLSKLEAENLDKNSEEYSNKVDEIIDYLNQRRIEFEPVRKKLIALIDAASVSDLDDKSKIFVEALVAYFPIGTAHIRHSTASSETLTMLEIYRAGLEKSKILYEETPYWILQHRGDIKVSGSTDENKLLMSLSDILIYVSRIILNQRNKWSIVCEAYAPLKIAQSRRWF
jgi:hypothetical protein